jgi:hypothetical protein
MRKGLKDSLSLNDPTSFTREQILEARRDRDADDWDRGKERARQEKEEREAHQ